MNRAHIIKKYSLTNLDTDSNSEISISKYEEDAKQELKEIINKATVSCETIIKKYKDKEELLSKEYDDNNNKLLMFHEEQIDLLNKEHDRQLREIEKQIVEYKASTKKEISETLKTIFENIYKTQIRESSTIATLIDYYLEKFEDASDITISLRKDSMNSYKSNYKNKYEELKNTNIKFKIHSKDSLVLDIKTDLGCVEVDSEKQIADTLNFISDFS